MVTNMLLLITLGPIILGLLGLFLPNLIKKILGVLLLAVNLCLAILLFTHPSINTALFTVDALSRLIILLISLLGFLIFIYALRNIPPAYEGPSLLLILLSVGFSNGAVVSGNMISFVICWGISGLMLYFYGLFNPSGADATKKTFLMMGGSDLLLIIGLAIIWITNQESFQLYPASSLKMEGIWSYLAFFCLLLAVLTKAGGFPMHTWVPAFCEHAPIEGVALLPAVLDKLIGIYFLTRMMTGLFNLPFAINLIVMTIGALTIVTAGMMALVQANGRRLLGYGAVSQVGYMILGLGTGSSIGIIGGLFQLINCAIYKMDIFLAFGSVEKRIQTLDINKMGGLAKYMPWTFGSSLVGILAMAGLPPLNGFVSKWLIYQSLVMGVAGQPVWLQIFYVICLIIAVFGSGLTLASFLKLLYTVYFGKSKFDLGQLKEISINNWLVTVVLAAFCLVLGVFAFPLVLNGLLSSFLAPNIDFKTVLPGFYQPYLMFYLLGVGLFVTLIGYLVFRKIRFDQNYVGGQEDADCFTVSGTHFYNDVRLMPPLKTIYDLASQKVFDIYHWIGKLMQYTGGFLQKMHTGVLPIYTIWMIMGYILVVIVLLGSR